MSDWNAVEEDDIMVYTTDSLGPLASAYMGK